MDGFIVQNCFWLVILVKIVNGWFYWSKLFMVGFIVQNCFWLVLLVKIVSGWFYWSKLYMVGYYFIFGVLVLVWFGFGSGLVMVLVLVGFVLVLFGFGFGVLPESCTGYQTGDLIVCGILGSVFLCILLVATIKFVNATHSQLGKLGDSLWL